MAEDFEFPVLEGWITLAEAAIILGITKQSAHRMARPRRGGGPRLTTVHALGARPLLIVREAEVRQLLRDHGDQIRTYQDRARRGLTASSG